MIFQGSEKMVRKKKGFIIDHPASNCRVPSEYTAAVCYMQLSQKEIRPLSPFVQSFVFYLKLYVDNISILPTSNKNNLEYLYRFVQIWTIKNWNLLVHLGKTGPHEVKYAEG